MSSSNIANMSSLIRYQLSKHWRQFTKVCWNSWKVTYF